HGTGTHPRAVVLLRHVDVERELVVHVYVVELRGRLVVLRTPGRTAIARHGGTAVIRFDEQLGVVRVDPERVVVTVRRFEFVERLAAVVRNVHIDVRHVDRVRILGVDVNAHVIERALGELVVAVDERPGPAGVVRLEQTAGVALVVGLDQRVDDVGIAGRDRDPGLADDPVRQAWVVRDVAPVRAAIGALVDAAARAAAGKRPGPPRSLPRRGVQRVRGGRIHGHRDHAGVVVDVEHLVPGLAAVGAFEDAALGVWSPDVAKRGGIDHVRILRIDEDPTDDVRGVQPDVLPALAAIHRLVHPLPGQEGIADVRFACADVDDLGVRWRDRDRANDVVREMAVRDVLPRLAIIEGFPDPAIGRAHVEMARLAGDAGHRNRTPADIGTDVAPLQCTCESCRGHGGCNRHGGSKGETRQGDEPGQDVGISHGRFLNWCTRRVFGRPHQRLLRDHGRPPTRLSAGTPRVPEAEPRPARKARVPVPYFRTSFGGQLLRQAVPEIQCRLELPSKDALVYAMGVVVVGFAEERGDAVCGQALVAEELVVGGARALRGHHIDAGETLAYRRGNHIKQLGHDGRRLAHDRLRVLDRDLDCGVVDHFRQLGLDVIRAHAWPDAAIDVRVRLLRYGVERVAAFHRGANAGGAQLAHVGRVARERRGRLGVFWIRRKRLHGCAQRSLHVFTQALEGGQGDLVVGHWKLVLLDPRECARQGVQRIVVQRGAGMAARAGGGQQIIDVELFGSSDAIKFGLQVVAVGTAAAFGIEHIFDILVFRRQGSCRGKVRFFVSGQYDDETALWRVAFLLEPHEGLHEHDDLVLH